MFSKIKNHVLISAFVVCLGATGLQAQNITATTTDGKVVTLNQDGTWSFVENQTNVTEGKVNLLIASLSSGSSCRITLQYENLTNVFFEDFAAKVLMMDRNGYTVGSGCGVGMENLRPNALATCSFSASNIPCQDISSVVVSGWQYCEVEGRSDSSGRLCDPYLNVVPSTHRIPLIQR